MGSLMMMIAVFGILVAVVALMAFLKARADERRQERLDGPGPSKMLDGPRTEVNVNNLRIGDIVTFFGTDYVVEGCIHYDDSGWVWVCYMLVDGDNVRWLAVEFDDQLEVSLWQEIDLVLPPTPPHTIDYDGERFTLTESGRASATQSGQTGLRSGLSVEYFEYKGSGERYLSVEKWGMETEVSVGQDVNPYSLEILPGGGSSFG